MPQKEKQKSNLKEITISEKGSYELDLQASSTQDINKKLNEIQ